MTWRPSKPGNAFEMFETPCQVPFYFYGPLGEQCRVSPSDDASDMDNSIAVECHPEDRARLIEVLAALLDEMRRAT